MPAIIFQKFIRSFENIFKKIKMKILGLKRKEKENKKSA